MKKWVYIVLTIGGFIMVRMVGKTVFYDPLISFFHEPEYSLLPLPEIGLLKYVLSLFLRYLTNLSLTIALVYLIFQKVELVKFTMVLYGVVFMLLTPVLILLIINAENSQYQFLFYVRRMLMHPVLTLIYIPALLYHEHSQKLNTND